MEPGYRRHLGHRCWADNVNRLPNPPLHLHLVHALLRPVRIDLVRSRSVCPGLDPLARARPSGQNLLREHDDLPMLGPLVRNLAITDVRAADHRSNAV